MGMGGSSDGAEAAEKANGVLKDALAMGLPYSEMYTDKAIKATEQATEQARSDQKAGYEMAQGLDAPYRLAGYTALDDYMDTLTLERPEMGSFKLANALEQTAKREQALTQLGMEVDNVKDYQAIENINSSYIDPETGQEIFSPGMYAENMLKLNQDMLKGGWHATTNTSQGYAPLDQYQGYLRPSKYNFPTGGTFAGMAPQPMTAREQAQNTVNDLSGALGDFQRNTQYYTKDHGTIASSFNKGLLGDARWKNVGTSPVDSLLAQYGGS